MIKLPANMKIEDMKAYVENGKFVYDASHRSSVGPFICPTNLTTLEGCPAAVGGFFRCSDTHLTSLKYGPTSVGRSYYCEQNNLTSFDCEPTFIGTDLELNVNHFKNLHNIHLHFKRIGGYAAFSVCPIESHVLGLLKIDKLKAVYLDNEQVEKILNKYLKGSRDILDCQEELIEAGLSEFAQL